MTDTPQCCKNTLDFLATDIATKNLVNFYRLLGLKIIYVAYKRDSPT